MQILKRHTILVLISLLLAIALTVSIVIIIQNKPPISTPFPSPTPMPTSMPSPSPSQTRPTPPVTTTPTPSPTPTTTSSVTPQPTATINLLPGEISTYQGQTLTPINLYVQYLFEHPDVAIAGTQHIDRPTYHLAITGMVSNPITYSYDAVVNNFTSTLQVATLPCVEGWSVTLLWQGVPITDLLQQAGVSPNANTLIFLASDGYSSSLPLDYVKQNNIIIAYKMNNITLTDRTGWPFFLVANNQYGYKWVEWLTEINVSNDTSYLGYWESRGLPNNATVRGAATTAQFSVNVSFVLLTVAVSVVCVVALAVFVFRHVLRRKNKQAFQCTV